MQHCNRVMLCTIVVLSLMLLSQARSYALVYPISVTLSGAAEVPPNASPGTGSCTGTYDDATMTLSVSITFSGLLGNSTAAHFHAPATATQNAGVKIGLVGFPVGVTSGSYSNSYVLTAQQQGWLLGDSVYLNIHTNLFPGGELRAQIVPDAPLPVNLASFSSVISRNDVTLNWSTFSESNNSRFEIERSNSNLNNWSKAGSVQGNGTTSERKNYSFTDAGLNSGTYNYRLKQIDYNGNFEYFNLTNEVAIGIPQKFSVSQNYPNPFNPSTKIDFDLPVDGMVSIVLYDMSGKEAARIVNEFRSAGYYTVNFDASGLSSGMYLYRISSDNFSDVKKMMLLK